MLKLVDFNGYEQNLNYYGGEAGAKLGITYNGENWLLKYPKSTKMLIDPKVSYTTSPLSEYIGSQVYAALGIPVHQTALGHRDGKVVVGCKDFLKSGDRLIEFKNIKNTYNPQTYDSGTSGSGTLISETLTVIRTEKLLKSLPDAEDRFWDMFVVDMILGNQDRNNTNWGVIISDGGSVGLAPVYDNGAALFEKRDEGTFTQRLKNEQSIIDDAVKNLKSVYIEDDGRHINPAKRIQSPSRETGLERAVVRIDKRMKKSDIAEIIGGIPLTDSGYKIIGEAQARFYIEVIGRRMDIVHQAAQGIDKDKTEYTPDITGGRPADRESVLAPDNEIER